MRIIDYRSERWTNNFLARAEDDEALMKCAAVVPGIKPAAVFVKLHVDCEYTLVIFTSSLISHLLPRSLLKYRNV
jgi:hypothetical protein